MTDAQQQVAVEQRASELLDAELAGHFIPSPSEWRSASLRAITRALDAASTKQAEGLICALGEAAFTFETYAKLHSAKGTPEGHEKAAKNARMAERCRTAIAEYRALAAPHHPPMSLDRKEGKL